MLLRVCHASTLTEPGGRFLISLSHRLFTQGSQQSVYIRAPRAHRSLRPISSSSSSLPHHYHHHYSTMSTPALFQPIQIGDAKLSNRVVLAPLTRFRADNAHVHTDLGLEYYKQRSSVPGTLLITEATYITAQAGGMPNAPGIWSDAQIAAWKKVRVLLRASGRTGGTRDLC